MNRMLRFAIVTAALAVSAAALAQGTGSGAVATVCAKDIAKYCAAAGHGSAQTRTCLEQHREEVSAACRKALDTTGRGRRR